MKIEIRYDLYDEIEPAAARLLADEIRASDQFGPQDEVTLTALTWRDHMA